MRGIASTVSQTDVKSSKAWGLVVAGYSVAAVGLVAFLTINGASGIPTVAMIGTAGLLAIGLLLPAAGMLQLRRGLNPSQSAARYGFAMQGLGLVGIFFCAVTVFVASSLSGYLVSAVLILASGALAMVGAVFLRRHYAGSGASNARNIGYFVIGTALIFSGVGLIVGSNMALYSFLISQVENTVYVDMGATVSASGCVVAAYSFFVLHNST